MRWFLAGLCFVALLGMAVATAALKASNVADRARLLALERRVLGYTVECARRDMIVRDVTRPRQLAAQWQTLQQSTRVRLQ